jgi:MFS family permease
MKAPAPAPAPDESLRRLPGFMRFWSARLLSTAASQMMMVALGWQMYDLTGSAWDLGLVGLAQFLPALLLALPAGHLVDGSDRKRVLAAAMAVQLVVAVVLAMGSHQQVLGRDGLLALSLVLGGVRAFQMPASQALLPQLVPVALLPKALALASSAMQGAIIAGPALGGALYAAGPALLGATSASAGHDAGAMLVYAVSAAGFTLAVAAVMGLHPRPAQRARERLSWASMLAGAHFIWSRKTMLGAVSLDLFAVLLGGATALLPIFAKDILQVGPTGLGLLRGAPAAGALAMSLALARWPVQRRSGRWLFGSVALYGVAMVAFGMSSNFWLSLAALALSGAVDMVSVVIRHTLVQLETPDTMRGRVSAINSVFIGASNQLGEFESGATAAWLGPVGSVVAGGIGTMLVVLAWMKLFPDLARRDRLVRDDADKNGAGGTMR